MIRLEVAQEQTDRARRRLETLVSMRPDHPYAHGLLGEILTISGHQEEAVIHFREATRINPTWVTPWVSWVNLSIVRGQPEDAIRIFNEGVITNKSSEELYMLMASILSNQGQIDGAIVAYESVLRMNPRNIFSANNLASLLVDHKGDAASLQRAFILTRDFEKDAPHPLFLDTLGWVRLKMGHPDQALHLLKQAIAKAPDLPAINYHLGLALHQSGHTVEASTICQSDQDAEAFQGRREAEQLLARSGG